MGTPFCMSKSLCEAECCGDCAGGAERADWEGKNQRVGDDLPLWPCAGGVQSFALGPAYGYASLLKQPSDQEVKEQFNASVPSEDLERFAKSIADCAEKMTTYAGSAADPGEYGKLIAARLCPNTLPYELGTSAAFEVASFNGRALGDDVLDVMLTLAANMPIVDGLLPTAGAFARISRIMDRRIRRRSRSG